MSDLLAPFYSTYLNPWYTIFFNILWILALGLGTALVVIGIPRLSFYFFQRAKNKRDISALTSGMEEDEE